MVIIVTRDIKKMDKNVWGAKMILQGVTEDTLTMLLLARIIFLTGRKKQYISLLIKR